MSKIEYDNIIKNKTQLLKQLKDLIDKNKNNNKPKT